MNFFNLGPLGEDFCDSTTAIRLFFVVLAVELLAIPGLRFWELCDL